MKSSLKVIASLAMALALASGCSGLKKKDVAEGGNAGYGYGSGESSTGGIGLGTLDRVHFDFDRSTVSAEAAATLKKNAGIMKDNKAMRVLVEGHCDDRGTNEYNISLGERRAKAVVDYLVSLGVARSRLESKSWGEERPLDTASTEEAFAANRRAEFVILAK